MSGRLTDGFREMVELRWSEFVEREGSDDITNFETILISLIRAASRGNLRAIQSSLDRLDGKIATEIEVEYPKFYTLYPHADKTVDGPAVIEADPYEAYEKDEKLSLTESDTIDVKGTTAGMDELIAEEELPTGSLRAVLERMLKSKKTIVPAILNSAEYVDNGNLSTGNPYVKSVIVAGLMKLVHEGRINAVFEIFEQIDGKVADKMKVLGDDVFIYNYSTIAPAGAVKNKDGIYQVEADNTTSAWVARLEERNNARKNR